MRAGMTQNAQWKLSAQLTGVPRLVDAHKTWEGVAWALAQFPDADLIEEKG